MIPNPYDGTFIVFEGIDGCGKSVQLNHTYGWLKGLAALRHHEILKTKEPNKEGDFGKKIYAGLADKNPNALRQKDPHAFQTWYACDSKENLKQIVIPALKLDSIVLGDRFRPSMVYGAQVTGEISELMTMNRQIIGEDFIWPDLVIIFDLSASVAIKCLKEKNRDLDEHEKHGVLSRVRHNYQFFTKTYPNCQMISAEESEELVFEEVKSLILPVIETKKSLHVL